MRLEDLTPGATIRGILPDAGVCVSKALVDVEQHEKAGDHRNVED